MPRPENNFDPAAGARPSRHVERRAQSPHGALLPELPTLGEIERRIMRCDDDLADLVEQHYAAAEEAAAAEADWKQHRDRCLLKIANSDPDDFVMKEVGKSQDLREAYAKGSRTRPDVEGDLEVGEDLYRTYKILGARETSIDRHIRSVQTRMTGLMSPRSTALNHTEQSGPKRTSPISRAPGASRRGRCGW